MTEHERSAGGGTSASPAFSGGETVLARLLASREADPSRVAVRLVHPRSGKTLIDQPLTIDEWLSGAARCARGLAARGIGPGDRVLVCLPTSAAFLHTLVGCFWLGAVPVPLPSLEGFAHSTAFLTRLTSVVSDSAPSAVVADGRTAAFLSRAEPLRRVELPLLAPFDLALVDGDLPPPRKNAPDEPAVIQYTSGSTGTPKGVVVTHGNLASNIEVIGKALRFHEEHRMVSWLPLYHDMGLVGGLLTPACHGIAVHLLSPLDFVFRPASWFRALSEYKATVTVAPNFAYSLAARRVSDKDLEGVDLSALRLAVNGAEPIDVATTEAFIARFKAWGLRRECYLPVYGLAEATLAAAFPALENNLRIDYVRRDDLAEDKVLAPAVPGPGTLPLVSVGRALFGHTLSVRDVHTGAELPERRLGEIILRGPSVSPYYFDRHQESPERRTELRTGDLGFIAEGDLFVVDRLKDLIIIAGGSYAPSDVEHAAEKVHGMRTGRSVAFSLAAGEQGTESLVVVAEAHLTLARRRRQIEEDVRRVVGQEVGLVPADVFLVRPGTLQRTSSGKVMRRDARDRYRSGELEAHRARSFDPSRITRGLRRILAGLRLKRERREQS